MNPITRALFEESDLTSPQFWHKHIFLPEDNNGLELRKVMLVVTAICLFNRPMTDFPDEIKIKIESDPAYNKHYQRLLEAKFILDKPVNSISREELKKHSAAMDTITIVKLENQHKLYDSTDFTAEGNYSGITSCEIFVFLGQAAHFLDGGYPRRLPFEICSVECDLYLFAALNHQSQMVAILAAEGIKYKSDTKYYSKFTCLMIAAHFDGYDFIDAFFSIQNEILDDDFSDILYFAINKNKSNFLKKIVQYGQPKQFNRLLDVSQSLPLFEIFTNCRDLKEGLDHTRLLIKSGAKPELLFSKLAKGDIFNEFMAEVYIRLATETSDSADLSYNFLTLLLQHIAEDELEMPQMNEAIQILRATCELYSAILNADFEKANNLLQTHSKLCVNLSVSNSPNLAHYILATQTVITPVILEILTLLIEKHHANVMIENSRGQLLHEIALVHPNAQIKTLLFNQKIDLFQTIFHDCNAGLIEKLLNANHQLPEVVLAEYRRGKERFQIELNSRQFFILFTHELVMLRNLIKADEFVLPKRFHKVAEGITINDPIGNVTHVVYSQLTHGEQANLEKCLVNLQR